MRNAVTLSSLLGLTVVGLLAGCPDRSISQPDINQGRVEYKDIPIKVNRDIDILFVIDDSPSMSDKQTNLKNNFPGFINVLNTIEGGLPNVHLGVVTSDLGTKGAEDSGAGPSINGCNASKNGNLQLSIPLPGHGEPDADELKFLAEFTAWMDRNAEGIHGTRPWKVYGEGPSVTTPAEKGRFGGAQDVRTYTAQDFRFVQKGGALYAFAMGWPDNGRLVITSLAENSPHAPGAIERVELLGVGDPLKTSRDTAGLTVMLPEQKVGNYAYGLKISGRGLTATS